MVRRHVGQDDPPILDEDRLEEIALMTRLMIEATGRSDQLSTSEIDELLHHSPVVLPIQTRADAKP